MAISTDLILEASDIDRISIQCVSCDAVVEITLSAMGRIDPDTKKPQQITNKCPSCGDDWQAIHDAIYKFREGLRSVAQYLVCFRLLKATKAGG